MNSNDKLAGILSRSHRTLKALASYHELTSSGGWVPRLPSIPNLPDGEKCFGVYVNDPTTLSDSVAFSSGGIHVFRSGQWDQIGFDDVIRALVPDSKENVTGFDLLQRDGRRYRVPIAGSKGGRFFDAFEVIRFIDRVLADRAAAAKDVRS